MARKNDDAAVPAGAVTAKTKKTRKPKKRRWYHQVWDAYKMTRQQDPAVVWWILGTFVVILGIAVGIGFIWGHPIYLTVLGLPTAILGAMFVLARRAEKAAYARIEGEKGATLAAVGTIRRGWTFDETPVAIEPARRTWSFAASGALASSS